MKLSELKQKLINTLPKDLMPIGINLGNLEQGGVLPFSLQTPFNIDTVKVIGVVGSRGKTTTCFIIHEFLKAIGKKSMLYSSAKIDSPAGFSDPEEGGETPLRSETIMLQLLLEAESYQPEFIVLEVNESAISRGFVKDIPFTARVLTNIFSNHHIDIEPEEQYVDTIKSFFRTNVFNEEAKALNIFGLTGNLQREGLNELINLNQSKSYIFGSKHIAEVRNTNSTNFDSLLLNCFHNIEGMEIEVSLKHEIHKFNTKMIMPYNALNITCALTVLQALDIFEADIFQKVISDLSIPGREEVFNFPDFKVISGLFLFPILEVLADYRNKGEINKIRLVTGASGTGFNGWEREVTSHFYVSQRSIMRREAMNYAKRFVDHIYLTESDSAAENPENICQELQRYIGNTVTSEIIINREEAIKKAIKDSESGDVLIISGRGNRNALVVSRTEAILFKDSNIIKSLMGE